MTTKTLLAQADTLISCSKNPEKSGDLPYITCNHILHQSSKKNKFKLMETSISLDELFTSFDKQNTIDYLWGGIYENNSIKDVFFIEELAKYILENKTIFVFVGFEEYTIDEDEKTKYNKETISHATTLILWPHTSKNKSKTVYNMYHFNPHGNYSKDVCKYEKYVTKYRKKTTLLSAPLDVYVMCKIKHSLNKAIKLLNAASNVTVEYQQSSMYNYWGPNLQVADKEGICFVYPVIFFKYVCLNEHSSHHIKMSNNLSRRLPSTSKLIQRGEWEKMFYLCLFEAIQHYVPHVRNKHNLMESISNIVTTLFNGSYNDSIQVFEDFLESYTHISTKALLNCFVKTFKDNSINTS